MDWISADQLQLVDGGDAQAKPEPKAASPPVLLTCSRSTPLKPPKLDAARLESCPDMPQLGPCTTSPGEMSDGFALAALLDEDKVASRDTAARDAQPTLDRTRSEILRAIAQLQGAAPELREKLVKQLTRLFGEEDLREAGLSLRDLRLVLSPPKR